MSDTQRPPLWRVMADAYFEGGTGGEAAAAEIRALKEWLVPEDPKPQQCDYRGFRSRERWLSALSAWNARCSLRAQLTAEAERAEVGDE